MAVKRKAQDADAAPEAAPGASQTALQVHRCRFLDWMPSAIHALAFSGSGKLLAVARATGDVELWGARTMHLVAVVAGSKQSQVTALCWAGYRLFVASLDGSVWEIDTQRLCKKNVLDANGGPIWSMVINAELKQLAVGCEDGRIRLFSFEDELSFVKAFLTTGGRVVSLAWHVKAQKIFSGSEAGLIHCWNASTGRNESRITLENLAKQKSVVWSLLVLDDLTLVSGDSSGSLCMWNAPTGTLLQRFTHLTADILSLCVNPNNTVLFASGVDNQVAEYRRCAGGKGNAWAYSYSHRAHSHDVRALALSTGEPTLVSGGIDTQLVWYRANAFSISRPWKVASMPYPNSIALANEKRVLMMQKQTSLDLWRLATQTSGTSQIAQHRKLLLQLNLGDKLNVACSALAPNASFIACSTAKELKLFALDVDNDYQPRKITTLPGKASGAARVLAFSPDSTRLVIASSAHQIRVLDLTKMELLKTFDVAVPPQPEGVKATSVQPSIMSLSISSDGQWLATGDVANNLAVYNLDSMQFYCHLPRPPKMHTSLGFNPSGKILVATLLTNSFVCYDVEAKGLSAWYRQNREQFPKELVAGRNIKGMSFDPANPDLLYLYSPASVYQINMGVQLEKPAPRATKKPRALSMGDEADKSAANADLVDLDNGFCRVINRYRPLSFVDFVADKEMVVVETPWLKVLSRLPGALHRHKYGK